MKQRVFFLSALVLFLLSKIEVIGQTDSHTIGITIPAVTMLRIAPTASKNITMNFTAPSTAGDPIVAPSNNTSLYLQYSSIMTAPVTSRKISVQASATVAGLTIAVTAANPNATNLQGAGGAGSTISSLSTTAADIITGITSCATGTAATDGSNLTYSIATTSASAYQNLLSGTSSITITYTLADN
ncbi:hypothetical protein [Flectobacillus longus]|uniref:hypothetical protein n=1 Tax=Flectobacillus longus TaxID=2984207 RepID=UPI0024B77D19|nr:hypothetical protein [Flectobacillus longus]MDI9880706.1 hypothetical protein [Flectobacillus longus]